MTGRAWHQCDTRRAELAESLFLHALMTGLLAAMIGLIVFFIASTDLPYRGAIAVSPRAYEIVLHDLLER